MKKRRGGIKLYLSASMIMAVSLLTYIAHAAEINWGNDFNKAMAAAKANNMPLMADFYTDWCGWCKKLDKDTYSAPEVIKLAGKFVCVKIDAEKYGDIARKYGVRGYPTIILFSPNGEITQTIGGYVPADILIGYMNKVPAAGEKAVSAPAKLASKQSLNLEGIVENSGKFKAMINGGIFSVGDAVMDAKIDEITKNKVRLTGKDGKAIILEA